MVRYIDVEGEKIPMKISFAALKNFQKEAGKSMLSLEGELSFEDIEILFWHGYVSGCKAAKSEGFILKYDREEIENLLDDCYMEFIELLPEFFPKKSKKK